MTCASFSHTHPTLRTPPADVSGQVVPASPAVSHLGAPIKPPVLQKLESGIGADFSHVRVHENAQAHEAARAINAKAFTHKSDIWLGQGESQDDIGLMAHEATHVVQQGAADSLSSPANAALQKRGSDRRGPAPGGGLVRDLASRVVQNSSRLNTGATSQKTGRLMRGSDSHCATPNR